ncbi:MAG: hypothetical protein HW421_2165, partial [Ignavibacteria bacterium]|nr:hypothetical protein [Ignavibacteria bacterium]
RLCKLFSFSFNLQMIINKILTIFCCFSSGAKHYVMPVEASMREYLMSDADLCTLTFQLISNMTRDATQFTA